MRKYIYFVGDVQSKEVAVVDPAWEVESILKIIEEEELTLKALFITNGHPDHTNVICGYARENELSDRSAGIRSQNGRQRGESRSAEHRTPTHEQTMRLLAQGLSIDEAARQRGFSKDTILGHIDQLVQSGGSLDLRAYLSAKDRLERIRSTLDEVGYDRLAPVKEALGEDYTYAEIRLTRAFVMQQNPK